MTKDDAKDEKNDAKHFVDIKLTESLENVDKSLLRKILNTGRNTPIPMLYLELGCMRIETILKSKRINFLHYIIKSDSEKSLHRFFKSCHQREVHIQTGNRIHQTKLASFPLPLFRRR